MNYKYGTFTENQIEETKEYIRKQIFFLLLIVDPDTRDNYKNVDVRQAFDSLQRKLGGLNELLNTPIELVRIASLLEAAFIEYLKEDFSYGVYRKLILDAGAEVLNIKGV